MGQERTKNALDWARRSRETNLVVALAIAAWEAKRRRAVGDVKASPPFVGPNDWKHQLQNQAAALGADVVLHEVPFIGSVKGKAYDCGGR